MYVSIFLRWRLVTVSSKNHQGWNRKKGEVEGKGKTELNLSEANTRAVSTERNELLGEFKIVAGEVIGIGVSVMNYTYFPTGIERELLRFGVDCDRRR